VTSSTISARSGRPLAVSRVRLRAPSVPRVAAAFRPSDLEGPLGFVLPFIAYLWVGWRLGIDVHLLPGDSLARVANASSAVFSRDPHPESIGFVWSPFPSLLEVPLVWLSRFWPALLDRGMAGVVVSALAMAGMVATVRAWMADLGLSVLVRWGLVIAVAAHPFTVLYGANGMSEAGMLCFLVIAARRFALWLERDRPSDLVGAGLALSMAYLFRYEVAGSIIAFGVVIAWITWRRSPGYAHKRRAWRAALRVAAGSLPPVFTVALWAFVSWAVVGEPFAQFSSKYGNGQNSSSVKAAAQGLSVTQFTGASRVVLFAKQLLVFGTPAIAAVVILIFFGTHIANRTTAALAILGAPLGFQLITAIGGSTLAWARFTIAAVPLGILLAGVVAARVAETGRGVRLVGAAAVVACFASVALAVSMIHDGSLQSSEERTELAAVPAPYGTTAPVGTPPIVAGRRIARDIDARRPRPGQILTDSSTSFTVVLNAHDQQDYVIPADRDDERILANPSRFGIRYVLVAQPSSAYDSVAEAWPGMFDHGGGIGHLIDEWGSSKTATTHYRLYELYNWDRR
jgi:hypothetical protein